MSPTTLEPLGQRRSLGDEARYGTTAEGTHLDAGDKLYPNGFQVGVGSYAILNWSVHDRYATLCAQFGMHGLNNEGAVVTVSFDDSTNLATPFFDKGTLVFGAQRACDRFHLVERAHRPRIGRRHGVLC